jgi:hypothetical protein
MLQSLARFELPDGEGAQSRVDWSLFGCSSQEVKLDFSEPALPTACFLANGQADFYTRGKPHRGDVWDLAQCKTLNPRLPQHRQGLGLLRTAGHTPASRQTADRTTTMSMVLKHSVFTRLCPKYSQITALPLPCSLRIAPHSCP